MEQKELPTSNEVSPLADHIHLYPNCMGKLNIPYPLLKGLSAVNAKYVGTLNNLPQFQCYDIYGKPWSGYTFSQLKNFKPYLRPLKDLKDEDFYSWFHERKGERLLKATVNGFWSVGYYDNKEYEERVNEDGPVSDYSLLIDMEDNDWQCVYSCSKEGIIAYGTGEEMRYFLDLHLLADWINHLRSRQIDCDALIQRGWAIDATTIEPAIKP